MWAEINAVLDQVKVFIEKSTTEDIVRHVGHLVKEHDKYRSHCINLHAAESVSSPVAQKLMQSDLEKRVMTGDPVRRRHTGHKYYDEIEVLAVELVKKLYRVNYVEWRLLSASVADGLLVHSLTEVGDTVLALEKPLGHGTWREGGYAGMRGLKIIDIPFDFENFNVSINGLYGVIEKIKPTKPNLMIVGLWCFLFPHPLKEMRELADGINAKIWYDGAHVMGLIPWEFQDPLREGADVITGSTHKTLSGPIGGLLLTNNEEIYEKARSILSGHQSALGHNRIASLIVTLAEMLAFGKYFARQLVANAKILAKALDVNGFDLIGKNKDYTESHTVMLDIKEQCKDKVEEIVMVAKRLEQANIMCSALPWRLGPYYPLRLGVTEMTRYGMKEPEMKRIAELIRRVVIDEEDPRKVAKEVIEFRKGFMEVQYCFQPGKSIWM